MPRNKQLLAIDGQPEWTRVFKFLNKGGKVAET